MKQPVKTIYIRVISFLSFLCVVLAVSTIIFAVRAGKYKASVLVSNERAVSELCENLDSITTDLQKSLFCSGEEMLSTLGTELYKSAAAAKVGLGQLTEKDFESDGIYKFLSQVGDYTLALEKKLADGKTLTDSDRKALSSLCEYSKTLSGSMDELLSGTYDSTVLFEKAAGNLSSKNSGTSYFSDGMNDTEQSLADYPTLIYDGPFADSVLNREALFVKGKRRLTQAEAKTAAARLLSCRESELRTDSSEAGALELYCFSKGEKAVAITKSGGYLCYITNPDHSLEAALNEKQAAARAKEFLIKNGYPDMTESYYSTYDGVCTVNFAYKKGDIIYYADLIKVSVALDSGKVVAADARGFLSNHCERELKEVKVTLEQAKKKLSSSLALKSTALAMIPCKDGKERLCYELHAADTKQQEALIYIDAVTGEEDNILLLLYSDGGVLTR